jgi:DNA-binding LacI/PurR family transcriptional regulator
VLAGATTVDPVMAQAVLSAAQRLGYQTNQSARSLRSGRSGSIGLITATSELYGFAGPFTAEPLRGATRMLSAASIQPVLLLEDGTDPMKLVRYLCSGHVDAAVVVLMHEIRLIYEKLGELPIPIVYIGHPTPDETPVPSYVDADNYGGARLATRALLTAGRREIAIIAGPSYLQAAAARVRGYQDELAEWSVKPGPLARGDFSMPTGAAAMARLISRAPQLDGVFACSDLMAVGALRVLEGAGRRVPDDVSLVGFDDTVVASAANPPLTSIRQPLEEMGREAARIALEALEGAADPVHLILPTTLVERESV